MSIQKHVRLRKRRDRKNFTMYYRDPETGKEVWKDSGCSRRSDADRAAALWEKESNEGVSGVSICWDAFRINFEDKHLIHCEIETKKSYRKALNNFERYIGRPSNIRAVGSATLSKLASEMKKLERARATIQTTLTHIKAAFKWAKSQKYVSEVPTSTLPKVKTSRYAKGRPITSAEFDLLLTAAKDELSTRVKYTPKHFKLGALRERSADMVFLLKGLRHSGLRIEEAKTLDWNRLPVKVDLKGGKYPRFIFSVEGHKGREDVTVPMTPEFAELLESVPVTKRVGKVFKTSRRTARLISAIGVRSKIVVNNDGKFVSAHDLRRTFATEWSYKVRPIVLQKMMRHKSIETTLKFYVDQEADDVGREVWDRAPEMHRAARRKTPSKKKKGAKVA